MLISGMQGNGCRERITAALQGAPGVKEADVNLYRGRAVVVHDSRLAAQDLVLVVRKAGYDASVPGRRGLGAAESP